MNGHLRVVGDASGPLPYPRDEVTNALVELDAAEAAVLAEVPGTTARARTADRLAAAYIAAADVYRRPAQPLTYRDWLAASDAAANELREAEEAYREAWSS